MKLIEMVDYKDITLTETLKKGLVRYYASHTEGGGMAMRDLLVERIKQHGKQSYKRGYEWCSGSGPLGYELLDQKIVEHITFSDYYSKAITDCLLTAEKNNIEHSVSAFVTGVVSNIPQLDKWDLVVSNPPHVWDLPSAQRDVKKRHPKISEQDLRNICRVLVDEGMETHKEFFGSIRSRLTDDADLFIIEHDHTIKDVFISMAEAGGLKFVDWYDFAALKGTHPHKLMHFKSK